MLFQYALQKVRTIASGWFHHFGIHCATHQIRVILISCVVITSLFYPALALYSSSHSRDYSSTRLLDTFLSPNPYDAHFDLHSLWSGYGALRARDDPLSRATCGLKRTIRVERVLVQSLLPDNEGALNAQILFSTLRLEHRISGLLQAHKIQCLRAENGKCFVLSPLAFWNYDEQALMADSNILDTLSLTGNVSTAGVTVTPHMVLAGRRSSDHAPATFDSATFLVLSYFFPDTDCIGSTNHAAFVRVLKMAAEGEDLVTRSQEPALIALEYDPTQSSNKVSISAISTFLYLAYAGFFAYVTWSMRHMDGVHSRVGLTFTALIEIAVSTITSLSVCALVGFKVTMVPWELFPIVILFVGAENMFNLVFAVCSTSVSLSVKRRIAEGLSRAGTSNTLKVVSYNAILGTIAFFEGGAIQQFCVFAIVVLIAHWFLAHTFFMAVLSIDIQRLELEELLRQNTSLASTAQKTPREASTSLRPRSSWKKLGVTAKSLLQGRATKNISLFLLLAITATLYYATSPTSNQISYPSAIPPTGGLNRPKLSHNGYNAQSPAWLVWKLLNPAEDALLHLRIELPMVLTFGHAGFQRQDRRAVNLRPVFWLLKIVVLPITATTTALYGLLLYLLKNAELLEAQRHREDPLPGIEMRSTLGESTSFTTLPRLLPTDVELLSSSRDGKVIASVGMQNELLIYRTSMKSHLTLDVTDVLLRGSTSEAKGSTLTALAVDAGGRWCAVGTGAGVTAVWVIEDGGSAGLRPMMHLWADNVSSSVVELEFASAQSEGPNLLVVHANGLAAMWKVSLNPSATYLAPSHAGKVKRARIQRVGESYVVAYAMADGSLQVLDPTSTSPGILAQDWCVQAGNPSDVVSLLCAKFVESGGTTRLVIAATTEAGVVSLWDGLTAECIAILEEVHGYIDSLRISPLKSKTCEYCRERPPERFAIAVSVHQLVLVYTVYAAAQTQTLRCSCHHPNQPRQGQRDGIVAVGGRRSRSNSLLQRRSSNAASFRVSGHGVHSRRASEKEKRAESSTSSVSSGFGLSVPPEGQEHARVVGPPVTSHVGSRLWKDVLVVRTGDALFDRRCWDVWNGKVVGLRRRARADVKSHHIGGIPHPSLSSEGLTKVTLERWELWTFDISSCRFASASLDVLSNHDAAPAVRSVPRLPFTRVAPFILIPGPGSGTSLVLAGFGNTVGVIRFS